MQPKDLVAMINDASAPQPLIFNIGPAGLIKNAIDIGPVSKKENFDSLKSFLAGVNRDR